MNRLTTWSGEMQSCSLRKFRNILTKNGKKDELAWAKEAGFNLGRVLALRESVAKDLSPAQVEDFRRRYAVVPRLRNVMLKAADEHVPYWERWFTHYYTSRRDGARSGMPESKTW